MVAVLDLSKEKQIPVLDLSGETDSASLPVLDLSGDSGQIPVLNLSEETAVEGLFGTKFGTRESPFPFLSPEVSEAALAASREPARLSRGFFRGLTEKIPEAKTPSERLNLLINLRKNIPEIAAELSSSMIDPETGLIFGAGAVARPILKTAAPYLKPIAEKVAEKLPTASKFFTRQFTIGRGRPEKYIELREQAKINISLQREKAEAVAETLTKDLKPFERMRIKQILKGGISESEREAGLRVRAAGVRQELDRLKTVAKQEGLLSEEAFFDKLTKRRVNELRLAKEKLYSQTDSILGLPAKEKITGLVGGLKVKGAEKVSESIDVFKNAVRNSPDITTVDLLDIGKKVKTGFDVMQTKIANLLELNTTQKARLLDLVGKLNRANTKDKVGILTEIMELSDKAKLLGYDEKTRILQRLSLLDDFVSNIEIGGINRLEKFAGQFEFRFKGQAGLLNDIKGKIGEINDRLWINTLYGGTPYTPRLFLPKEIAKLEKKGIFGFKGLKVTGDAFKRRQFFTEAEEQAMGIIEEPAYPFAKRIFEIGKDVETIGLFNKVARNADWSSDLVKEGFEQIPNNVKQYGKLAGKFVQKEIFDDITEITAMPTAITKFQRSLVTAFKVSKTVMDPAIHATNTLGNSLLLDFSGVSLARQPGLLKRAFKEIRSNGAFFQEAKKQGAIGGEFSTVELSGFLEGIGKPAENVWEMMFNLGRKVVRKPGELYQANEQLFKMAKYLDGIDKGLSSKAASAEAQKWLFNYGKVSKFTELARGSIVGIPFLTFWSKAIPRVAETAIKNPMKLYKYKLLFDAVEKNAVETLNLSSEEIDIIKRNSSGLGIMLPFRDKQGAVQTINLGRVFFPTSIFETGGGLFGLPSALTPGGIIRPLAEVGLNVIGYKRKQQISPTKIYLETDTPKVKARKSIDYLYRSYFPSFSPPIPFVSKGGQATQKLLSSPAIQSKLEKSFPALTGTIPEFGKIGDYAGRVRNVASVLFDIILGLRMQPMNPELLSALETLNIKKEQIELTKEGLKIIANKGLTENEKVKQMDSLKEKMAAFMLKNSEIEDTTVEGKEQLPVLDLSKEQIPVLDLSGEVK